MDYQEHLLKNVFNGDKERFEKAWQEALDDGCDGAVSWTTLLTSTQNEKPVETFAPDAFYRFEGLPNTLTTCHYEPFISHFIWKK